MKTLLVIGVVLLVLFGWVVIYALCRVSGIQSELEDKARRARYEREKKERERDSW